MPDIIGHPAQARPWSSDDEERLAELFRCIDCQGTEQVIVQVDGDKSSSGLAFPDAVADDAILGGSVDATTIRGQLDHAVKQARQRRMRISIPTVTIGGVLVFVGLIGNQLYVGTGSHLFALIGGILPALGFLALLLGVLPSDRRAVPCAAYSMAGGIFLLSFVDLFERFGRYQEAREKGCQATTLREDLREIDMPCWLRWAFHTYTILIRAISFAFSAHICYRLWRTRNKKPLERSREVLQCLWWVFSVGTSCMGSMFLFVCIMMLSSGAYAACLREACICISWSAVASLSWPRVGFRRRLQSWLTSFSEGASVAAGVAELLGGKKAEDVIVVAKKSFCYISAEHLIDTHMAENSPNPELSQLAQKGCLGDIDAFVSHSWHDDSRAKWRALQQWRQEFKEQNQGREPKLWIDKYCIDQNNIDESLVCLPVYLSACKQLLILCGKTYLQRLWCLVELFVFLQMRARVENLDVRFLSDVAETSLTPSRSLAVALDNFDPRQARCVDEYDTDRLQAVIEASDLGVQGMQDFVREAFLNNIGIITVE